MATPTVGATARSDPPGGAIPGPATRTTPAEDLTVSAPDERPGIDAQLAAFDDIPGTRVFTGARARRGYYINQCAMSLMKPDNRVRFKADERAYLDEWPLSDAAKQAWQARDFNTLLDLGGNIYFLAKIIATDGLSVAEGVSSMTDMTFAEYQTMMLNGGRPVQGNRSIKGDY